MSVTTRNEPYDRTQTDLCTCQHVKMVHNQLGCIAACGCECRQFTAAPARTELDAHEGEAWTWERHPDFITEDFDVDIVVAVDGSAFVAGIPDKYRQLIDWVACSDNSFENTPKEPGLHHCRVRFEFSQGYFEGYRADGESDWSFTVLSSESAASRLAAAEQRIAELCEKSGFNSTKADAYEQVFHDICDAISTDYDSPLTTAEEVKQVVDENTKLESALAEARSALEGIFLWYETRYGTVSASPQKGAPNHAHLVEGIWDSDNKPEIANKPCEHCKAWDYARDVLARIGEQR